MGADRVFGGHALLAIPEEWNHKMKDRRPRGSKEIPVRPLLILTEIQHKVGGNEPVLSYQGL